MFSRSPRQRQPEAREGEMLCRFRRILPILNIFFVGLTKGIYNMRICVYPDNRLFFNLF
jgi:hypothetical protein